MAFSKDTARKYLELAQFQANLFSNDPDQKVGTVLLGKSMEILGIGHNSIANGIRDSPHRWERPAKYMWVEHSERNAIFNAARNGIALDGCIAVATLFPCADCARALIQVGARTLVVPRPDMDHPRWGHHFKVACEMLAEAHVEVVHLDRLE